MAAHEIILKSQLAFIRNHARGDGIVAHWQNFGAYAKGRPEMLGNRGEALAFPQAPRPLHMQRKIRVAEPEPGLSADRFDRAHEIPRFVGPPPALFGMRE